VFTSKGCRSDADAARRRAKNNLLFAMNVRTQGAVEVRDVSSIRDPHVMVVASGCAALRPAQPFHANPVLPAATMLSCTISTL
jgi:hypothetical protein